MGAGLCFGIALANKSQDFFYPFTYKKVTNMKELTVAWDNSFVSYEYQGEREKHTPEQANTLVISNQNHLCTMADHVLPANHGHKEDSQASRQEGRHTLECMTSPSYWACLPRYVLLWKSLQ